MPSLTPNAPSSSRWPTRRLVLLLLLALLAWALWWVWCNRFGEPEDFESEEMQFKYGSIGADHPLAEAPLPYWLWKALPVLYPPATTIPGGRGPNNGEAGWKAFGLYEELGVDWAKARRAGSANDLVFDRPVGFSRRRVFGMDFVGLNCAFCHQGQLKRTAAEAPQHIVGGVGNTVDIEQYFLYLFSALTSKAVTPEQVMAEVDHQLSQQKAELGWVQRTLYRWVIIPLLPRYLGRLEDAKFDFIMRGKPGSLPDFGPGRVDTWSLYKRVFVRPAQKDGISGTSDFPPLWNQKVRTGMRLHWDGNTDVLMERNIISSLSLIGKRLEYLDFERLQRVTGFIEGLLPPRYEDRLPDGEPEVDRALANRGFDLFNQQCGRCHNPGGDRFGHVEPAADLGTDPLRFQEFTPELQDALNRLGTSQWQLRNFRTQTGYVNNLLDGIWLRAPYLHNGPVPTLDDLLKPPAERPKVFCRGEARYDWQRLGFVSEPVMTDGKPTCPKLFLYDTTTDRSGRSNSGHVYGTSLPPEDKKALLEFMKTL